MDTTPDKSPISISEHQLRKLSKKACNGNQHAMRYNVMLSCCFRMGKLVLESLREYGELKQSPRWVSVEERLPAVSDKPIYLALHPVLCDGDFPITQCGFSKIDAGIWPKVTHWMPLPSAPEESESPKEY